MVEKFKDTNDTTWAENLLVRVSGPTVRQQEDMRIAERDNDIPKTQGVGPKKVSVVRSLESSFSEDTE